MQPSNLSYFGPHRRVFVLVSALLGAERRDQSELGACGMRRAIYKPGEFVESDPRIAVTHRRSASNGEIVRQLRRWRIGARTLQDVSAEQYIVDTQI